MRVLIVDDEPLACEGLVRLVGGIVGFYSIGEAANGREAIEKTHELQPDVVLMDVRMPDMDGLEAARHLSTLSEPPAVIFTTAYNDHALEAFEARAIGYLLKPIRIEKLTMALKNTTRRNRAQQHDHDSQRTHICTSIGNQVSLIPVDEVLFFRAEQKYVTLIHTKGESLIEEPLRLLEKEFGSRFVRIHRNALVSVKHIEGMINTNSGKHLVVLIGTDIQLEISRRHLSPVRKMIKTDLTRKS
jgi:two-component system response regulator AlgR